MKTLSHEGKALERRRNGAVGWREQLCRRPGIGAEREDQSLRDAHQHRPFQQGCAGDRGDQGGARRGLRHAVAAGWSSTALLTTGDAVKGYTMVGIPMGSALRVMATPRLPS